MYYTPGFYMTKYGRYGTQLSEVLRGPSLSGMYIVRRWRAISQSWTKETRLAATDIIRPATAQEIAKAN